MIQNDLNHISGEEISKGNIKHIANLLELLVAISNQRVPEFIPCGGSQPDPNLSDSELDKCGNSWYSVMGIQN